MKKLLKFSAALSLISVFAIADSNTMPTQEPAPVVNSGNFYGGVGYAYMKMDHDTDSNKITGHAITLLAGYNFHKYIAAEGRYFATWGDLDVGDGASELDKNGDMKNIAIYLKPKYSVDRFTLYGLLGYGQTSLNNHTDNSENGFQWGLGANFNATDKVDVFVDFEKLYDDKGFDTFSTQNDVSVDSVNVGVVYNF